MLTNKLMVTGGQVCHLNINSMSLSLIINNMIFYLLYLTFVFHDREENTAVVYCDFKNCVVGLYILVGCFKRKSAQSHTAG